MKQSFQPKGVCAKQIDVEIENGVISHVKFTQGCNGNGTGISRLVEGMTATEAMKKLKGVTCGSRNTSCPDQLAQAIEKMLMHTD